MKVEYQIDFIDALVVIDPTVFNEMDDEFLYAFDIYLDKKGESELVYDFPDEEWNIVWNRETKSVQDFIESHKMIVWRAEKGDYEGELLEADTDLTNRQEIIVSGEGVIIVTASELIQCLPYPDSDMEIIADLSLDSGIYCFERNEAGIKYLKK